MCHKGRTHLDVCPNAISIVDLICKLPLLKSLPGLSILPKNLQKLLCGFHGNPLGPGTLGECTPVCFELCVCGFAIMLNEVIHFMSFFIETTFRTGITPSLAMPVLIVIYWILEVYRQRCFLSTMQQQIIHVKLALAAGCQCKHDHLQLLKGGELVYCAFKPAYPLAHTFQICQAVLCTELTSKSVPTNRGDNFILALENSLMPFDLSSLQNQGCLGGGRHDHNPYGRWQL